MLRTAATTLLVASALVASAPQRAESVGYTALYVFGSSREEIGNHQGVISNDEVYWPGRATNGYTYVEILADSLGFGPLRASTKGGTDYAWFAAWTDSSWHNVPTKTIREQLHEYLASLGAGNSADDEALYLFSPGNGEVNSAVGDDNSDTAGIQARAEAIADTLLSFVDTLAARGARHFATLQALDSRPFIFSLPDYLLPTVDARSRACEAFNKELGSGAGKRPQLRIAIISTGDWVNAGRKAGLNLVNPYAIMAGSSHPDNHFILSSTGDASAAAHRLLASVVLAAINRPPTQVTPIEHVELVIGTESWRHGLITAPPVFTDEDGDIMTFVASSSDTAVATATVSGSTVEVIPRATGTATIQVSATDPRGRVARSDFKVIVSAGGFGASLDLDGTAGNQSQVSVSAVPVGWAFSVGVYLSRAASRRPSP